MVIGSDRLSFWSSAHRGCQTFFTTGRRAPDRHATITKLLHVCSIMPRAAFDMPACNPPRFDAAEQGGSASQTLDHREARHNAHLTRGLEGGSVQQMMRNAAEKLLARGFRVDLLTPTAGDLPGGSAIGVHRLRRWLRSAAGCWPCGPGPALAPSAAPP
jgi:hypothetical protein